RAYRGAEDGLLADRGVADPLRPELLEQARGRLEYPAGRRHVLAEEHHVWIPAHFLGDTPRHCVSISDNCHVSPFGKNDLKPGRGYAPSSVPPGVAAVGPHVRGGQLEAGLGAG